MDIKASDVKALRDKTGAGMMECKKALVEANGDAAEAEKILKEKGLAAVAKRADRATAEGRIFVRQLENKVVMIEVTCETDFVANNKDFVELGEKSGLQETFDKLGMTDSKAHEEWGLSTTTPSDQLKLLNAIFYSSNLLSTSQQSYVRNLMQNVESDQQ